MSHVSEGVKKEIVRAAPPGTKPVKHGQKITVHCTGSQIEQDGSTKKFWSTKDPGQKPFEFNVGVGQVIKGWDEGCETMAVGEVAKITIDGPKGYGAKGFPAWGIKPNATLQFEIELLKAV